MHAIFLNNLCFKVFLPAHINAVSKKFMQRSLGWEQDLHETTHVIQPSRTRD